MSKTYHIIFSNNSGVDNFYGFFVGQPQVSANASGYITPWANVWISKLVPKDSRNFEITVEDTFYAWVGQAPSSPGPGITVSGGVGREVPQLGTQSQPGSTFQMLVTDNTPEFQDPDPPPSADPGAFSIITGIDFTGGANDMLGLGQKDNFNIIVPAATVLAQPNLPYNIAPVVKFWVAQGYSQQGELADFSAVSAQNGAIDFTTGAGVGQDTALVSQGPDGQFTITYASSGAHGKK